jgi:hypothetical protein
MSTILEALFSSTARVQILRLFLLNPSSQYYQREIERETGQAIRAVQREVKRLAEIELLTSSAEGNRVYYRLNHDFALSAELTTLFEKATGQEARGTAVPESALAPEPSTIKQPFEWLETLPVAPLPATLRELQVEGEWDRAY